ncbi:DNA replication/repair protein RecF [Agitococcus lubricus]|uniref:DNA replication and repair protein RecF n=1 Tax=Agitococcus lubricus TaxID=1077255 RepID=A0A2T5J3N4_9GAMM|nr:DNA replication/repair protein RecF [Agitococcus lubricus]PTQ91229.1 DNA replication and repair protein RecF [Agitococcus lubricus]
MLQRLTVSHVRNLQLCSLTLSRLNLFYGFNGSGKSSLLEAVYLLAMGRSFRSQLIRKVIQDGQQQCTVFARFYSGQQLGITKLYDGGQLLKRNGVLVNNMAEFAYDLPVQLIHPESMDLIDSGSKPRRQLLDWIVFHVEPDFYHTWQRYQRALLQRNVLLKSDTHIDDQLVIWEKEIASYALLLHGMRSQIMSQWQLFLAKSIALLLPAISIKIEYSAGFDVETDLVQQLYDSRIKDRVRGYTQLGAHRADIKLKTELGLAEAVLSRGQKKLLICALKLAQVEFLKTHINKSCVVLLDDLASELDVIARARLLTHLHYLDAQILITAVEADSVWPTLCELDKQAKLFHVEQGLIHAV